MNKIFILSLFLLTTASLAFSPPTLNRPVVDSNNFLSESVKVNIEETIQSLYQSGSGPQIAVLVVASLDDRSIEEVAEQVFNSWGLGSKSKDNGVLFLVAIEDRKMRIEVGYGLEGLLTDYQSAQIITNIKPYFKNEEYGEGIHEAVKQIATLITPSSGAETSTAYLGEAKSFEEVNIPEAATELPEDSVTYDSSPAPVFYPKKFPLEMVLTALLIIGILSYLGISVFYFVGWKKARKETLDVTETIKKIETENGTGLKILYVEGLEKKKELELALSEKKILEYEAEQAYRKTRHFELSQLKNTLAQQKSALNTIKSDIKKNQDIVNRGAY